MSWWYLLPIQLVCSSAILRSWKQKTRYCTGLNNGDSAMREAGSKDQHFQHPSVQYDLYSINLPLYHHSVYNIASSSITQYTILPHLRLGRHCELKSYEIGGVPTTVNSYPKRDPLLSARQLEKFGALTGQPSKDLQRTVTWWTSHLSQKVTYMWACQTGCNKASSPSCRLWPAIVAPKLMYKFAFLKAACSLFKCLCRFVHGTP